MRYLVKCTKCGATQWCKGEEDDDTNAGEYHPDDDKWIGQDEDVIRNCAHDEIECIDSEDDDPFPTPQDVRCLGD